MLCRASLTSPNLGVAMKRWCRHHRLLTDDVLLTLTVTSDVARVAIAENRRLGEARELCLLTSLRYLHGYACWAVDSLIPLRDVRFPFAPPAHWALYPMLFPGPVRFQAPQAGFSFDAQYLALPLRRDESALRTMLRRALVLTVRQYRRDRLLVQRVCDLLKGNGTALTADAAASALHVSKRTLHRQLGEEGASFQGLKDKARHEKAVDLLYRTTRSIKQIASAIGFRNDKSFARAFKIWTGETPDALRQQAKNTLGK
jgi:AraC-like DNA-binding protein